ncbi:dipeptidase [Falsiroseomonas bella]|uniref:Dipeptidase n=1 Tax=Falsiroseomonas bella TaxID=2184016 RepID=A0A317FEC7_9PROT|nr:membrane dipeptidase [Falsiroseomonas bella]PWS35938.1 dipeptidase [Falsiroseomonas bella]
MSTLHDRMLVIDGLVFYSDGDPRWLREGNVSAANVTIRSPMDNFETTFDAFASWRARCADPNSGWLLVERGADIDRAKAEGKVGLIMGWQDTKLLGDKVERIEAFHRLGLRIVQLTYNEASAVGDGCLEKRNAGLSNFGHEVVAELNRLNMAIDLSHTGEQTCLDTAAATKQPILLTHANARAVTNRVRNKPDEVIRAVGRTGGLVGVSLHGFMNWDGNPANPPTLDLFLRHLKHVVSLVGIDHVGFGNDMAALASSEKADAILDMSFTRYAGATADFIRAFGNTLEKRYPDELNNPRFLSRKTDALLRAGYKESEVEKIMGLNFRRVLGEIWQG